MGHSVEMHYYEYGRDKYIIKENRNPIGEEIGRLEIPEIESYGPISKK